MKKFTTRDILEHLIDASMESGYLLAAILESGYGASASQIERKSKEIRYRQSVSREGLLSKEERHNFSSMLSYLKKDGLIDKKEGKWRITKGGRDKLGKYVKKPRPNYPRTQSDNLKIIAFDIPEDKRNKRAWLRSALKNMGFKMIQQSMWAGKRNISRQFLDDLNRMEIIQYVDIFTVTKSGSLRSFKK